MTKKLRNIIVRKSISYHKILSWVGGVALLLFAISGIMHPVMSWTGPKGASFFPPQTIMQAELAANIPNVLEQNAINQVIMAKIVPSQQRTVLQVTEYNDKPRRYFNLGTGEELIGYDETHAIWLARYYTGIKNAEISDVTFQTAFDGAYPWVNRLLPVYKIQFDTEDNRTAFIYTELGALGNLTNDYKTTMQSIFGFLHTFNWLNDYENPRVILMLLLLLTLFAIVLTGTLMVFMMKSRKMPLKRKLHRLVSYIIWLPLLLFTFSGIYHLLQYSYVDSKRGLQLGESFKIDTKQFTDGVDWLANYSDVKLNGISIIEVDEGKLLYRLSIPQGRQAMKIGRQQRFDGMPLEKPAIYFDVATGLESDITDKEMAIYYASKRVGLDSSLITGTHLVTHFSPNYDFRNKRLPVWQVSYNTEAGDKLFIDPASGILVDRLVNVEKYESYSFSFLHKWNFLSPFVGRMPRDIIIVIVLSLSIIATIIGYIMLIARRK